MAKSPLETTMQQWNTRSRTLAGMGVPLSKFQQFAQQDINHVAQGGTGLTDAQIYDAVLSGANNQPIIQDPQPKTGLMDILGNIPKDIGGIATGFIPGLVNTAHHLPSEANNLRHYLANTLGRSGASEANWETSHGYEDTSANNPSSLAAGLRNVAKNPIAGMIPGIADAANLTTATGRRTMEQHPVGSILNVVPDVKGLTETAAVMGSNPYEIGLAAGQAGYTVPNQAAYKAGMTAVAGEETPGAALAQGRPVQALVRSISPLNDTRLEFLQRFGIDKLSTKVTAAGSAIERTYGRIAQDWVKNNVTPLVDEYLKTPDGKVNDLAMADITSKAQDPRIPRTPTDEALISALREPTQYLAEQGVSTGKLRPITWNDKTFYFSTEGEQGGVLAQLDRSTRLQDKIPRRQEELNNAQMTFLQRFDDSNKPQQPPPHEVNKETWDRYTNDLKTWEQDKNRELSKVATKQRRLDNAITSAKKASVKYNRLLRKTVPAEFVPMVEQDIRDKISAQVKPSLDSNGKLNGNLTMEQAFSDIQNGRFDRLFNQPEGFWSSTNFNKVKLEAAQTWQDMSNKGYDPIWVHNTDLQTIDRLHSTRPLSSSPTPTSVRGKTLNFSPKLQNLAVALSDSAREFLHLQASEDYIQNVLVPQSLSYDDVLKEIQPSVDKIKSQSKAWVPESAIQKDLLKSSYVKITSDMTGGFTSPRMKPIMDEEHYLPSYLADASRQFTNPKQAGELASIAIRGNRIFKFSVMAFSPTFLLHHLMGGTLSLIGRSGYEEFLPSTLSTAFDMAKNHGANMPAALSQGLDITSTEELSSFLMGDKAAKLLHAAGKAGQFNFKLVEFITNMQRSISYLGEEARQLSDNLTPEAAQAVALEHANKVFVDWNSMSGIERQTIRTVIPFYGFTKQILRYALTYPVDYPLRASILSNLAEAEQADWTSGLPRSFMQLFMFGKGDTKTAVSYATINPYRDIGNYFSLTGLLSSLNPFSKGVLGAVGVNTISGTPELYPQVTYDPNTGKLVAKRPSGGLLTALQDVVPEIGTIDHFLQLSSSMRRLASTNPESYRKQLFSSLGIPFVPYSVNIPYTEQEAELNRYKYAQQAASTAVKANSTSSLSNLNLVPYNDQLYTPSQLQQLLDAQTQAAGKLQPGETVKAVTVKKPVSKSAKAAIPSQDLAIQQQQNRG